MKPTNMSKFDVFDYLSYFLCRIAMCCGILFFYCGVVGAVAYSFPFALIAIPIGIAIFVLATNESTYIAREANK